MAICVWKLPYHNINIVALAAFVCLFSTVCFQMTPQMACIRRCKITLVAFIWFFSSVCFQMSPQIICPKGCIVALVAFVWLFSGVCFQMCPQIACPRRGKVTLVAFVWCFFVIICVSQGNTYMDCTFRKVIINKILIHHHKLGIVVPYTLSVSNWENECCRWTNESESHCWQQYERLREQRRLKICHYTH